MVKCPRCRKEFTKLTQTIENPYFLLTYYACDNCHHAFKMARVKYPTDNP